MEMLIITSVVCGVFGYIISSDHQKVLGTALGLLLGPIGLVIAALTCRDKKGPF